MTKIEQKPEPVLKQLALDIVEGKVFHSNMIEDPSMLHGVFMPITFLKEGEIDIENLGMLYEYMEKQGPRSVNGYPTFVSAQMLHVDDMEALQGFINQVAKMKQDFLTTDEIEPESNTEVDK